MSATAPAADRTGTLEAPARLETRDETSDKTELLRKIHHAFRWPAGIVFLGRLACATGRPVWIPDGLRDGVKLEEALSSYPWTPRRGQTKDGLLRLVVESGFAKGEGGVLEVRKDQPVSLKPGASVYLERHVLTSWVPSKGLIPKKPEKEKVAHASVR